MTGQADIVRKRDTGEPGNPGQFGSSAREGSGLTLEEPQVERFGVEPPEGIDPAELHRAIGEGAPWDAETVAIRDHWGSRDWEDWEDAREAAELEDARSAPREHEGATAQMFTSDSDGALVVQIDTHAVAAGRHLRVFVNDGPVFDGDPEAAQPDPVVHDGLLGGSWEDWETRMAAADAALEVARERSERVNTGVVVAALQRWAPGGRYMELERDPFGGHYFVGGAIVAEDGSQVGTFEDVSEDSDGFLAAALRGLDPDREYPFVVGGPGGLRLDVVAAAERG